ncbi:hypothetical protein OSSY52_14330 [Tepiditoga spiralis]|uniref:Uncharacterized protein n=1 Tax=Tepiditoga spiralis TaxID=2108365 RepID=A0A7G1GAQ2_9BACT|nr:hypothetical protein [Tepiditoga spiralis]BBE31292.1 hypothetical protein OSSY52_14330 [Tepiditoga spiralis]
MQVNLEQIINVIMGKLETLEMSLEDVKFRTNIALRVLRKNDLLKEEIINEAVKDEFKALLEMEGNSEIDLPEEKITEVSKGILNWVDNDLIEMKNKMKEYEEKMREMLEKENGPDISIAPPELLNQLDGMNKNKGNGKIIL